ncbi:MAG: CBS domain-containing protein [Candidatus Aenigmarchaeota archaeon]|nr:CBS domain-containing protein [Candidatus Aenigmarchaeota archaeon]
MELESVIEKAFIVRPDDSVSHVISKMAENKKHEAFLFDTEFRGIVTLSDVIKRKVSDPDKTKISYFAKSLKPFPSDASVSDVINYMMVSEYRTLPVKSNGEIFSVSKPKLLRFVKDSVFEGKKVKNVMQFPYCASESDDIKTVISTMKETGLSRLPILNKAGKFTGLADSLSLVDIVRDRTSSKRGDMFGDKRKLGEIGINKFTRKDVVKVDPDIPLKSIVKRISEEGACTVIVEKDEKFLGMITAKDIFKLIGKSLETVYVRVSGLDSEDNFIKGKVDDLIENTISKLIKVIPVTYVAVHVETHQSGGRRTKYSVEGRFVTEKGNFFAGDIEWDPTKAVKNFLDKIEREVHKKIDKKRGR